MNNNNNNNNNNLLIPSLKLAEVESVHQTTCKQVKAAVHYEMIDACKELEQLADLKVSGVFVTLKRGNTAWLLWHARSFSRTI